MCIFCGKEKEMKMPKGIHVDMQEVDVDTLPPEVKQELRRLVDSFTPRHLRDGAGEIPATLPPEPVYSTLEQMLIRTGEPEFKQNLDSFLKPLQENCLDLWTPPQRKGEIEKYLMPLLKRTILDFMLTNKYVREGLGLKHVPIAKEFMLDDFGNKVLTGMLVRSGRKSK